MWTADAADIFWVAQPTTPEQFVTQWQYAAPRLVRVLPRP